MWCILIVIGGELKANVSKSAVMVFARNQEEGEWMWGEHRLPRVCSYRYLGIDFVCNGAWDVHVKKVIDSGRTKLNQLHSVISNRRVLVGCCYLL